MLLRHSLFVVAAISACSLAVIAKAQDKPAEPAIEAKQPAEAKPAGTDFGELVNQLDADKFADRQAASHKLAEGGKAAIGALAEAAQGPSREASTRAVEILKNHFQKGDEATKAVAKEALEKISKGTNSAAARRAEVALNPKPENPQVLPGLPAGIRLVPGRVQIQVQGNAGGGIVRRVSIRVTNGVKEIDVDDNGKKVKILDDPNNGIKIEVTEKNKEGKEETKKYEAKNADELKKNQPDAHKIYEEYSKQPGGIQIQGIQIQGNALPFGAVPAVGRNRVQPLPQRVPPVRPAAEEKQQNERIDAAQKRLDEAMQQIKKLAQGNVQADELRKLSELIEGAKKQLEEAKAKIDE